MNMTLSALLAFTQLSVRYAAMGAVAFVTTGWRALSPKPGVYFVRAVSGKLLAVGCHRVIITR